MNELKRKKNKKKVVVQSKNTPPTFDVWTKEQLFDLDCVASVYTDDIVGMSIPELKNYIQKSCEESKLDSQFVYSRHHIGDLVSHHAVKSEMKKIAMSSIPYVLNNGHPITKWGYKTVKSDIVPKSIDRMPSCLYGAPIMIDDTKYLCLLTIKYNPQTGKVFPYVVNLEKKNENEMKVSDDISVRDNNNSATPSNSDTSMGTVTSQDNRAPSNQFAKVQQKVQTADANPKNNKQTKENQENIEQMYKTNNKINENRNMKQTIRLTESDLRNMIKEALNELNWKTYANAAMNSDFMDIRPYPELGLSYNDVKDIIRDPENATEKYGLDAVKQVMDGVAVSNKRLEQGKRFWDAADKAYANQLQGIKTPLPSYFWDIKNNPEDDETNWENEWGVDWSGLGDDASEEDVNRAVNTATKAQDEIKDFLKGKYKYEKGKGWVKNDDKLDEAITRAIRKLLR